MNSAIRRSQYRGGAGGRQKAALARLHSARSLNRSQGCAAGCRGSSLAPTGRRSFTACGRGSEHAGGGVAEVGKCNSDSRKEGGMKKRRLSKKEIEAMRAARASARKTETIVEGYIRVMWVPRLAGFNVSENGLWRFTSKADALQVARRVKATI